MCATCKRASYRRLFLIRPPFLGGPPPWLSFLRNLIFLGPVGAIPPAQTAYSPPNPAGFFTKVCIPCEQLIEWQVHYRTIPPPGAPTPWPHDLREDGPMHEWQLYPRVSCTCMFRLTCNMIVAEPAFCTEHLEDRLTELVAKRDYNDRWLCGIQKGTPGDGGLLERLSRPQVIADRAAAGHPRACRVSFVTNLFPTAVY